MYNGAGVFQLAVVEKNKIREYDKTLEKKLEILDLLRFQERYLDLDNDLVMILHHFNPSFLNEESRGIVYVECYPDDLVNFFEKIRLDTSLEDLREMLNNIDGFFTGFIVGKSRVVMFRDHVGAIPYNYKVDNESLIAASFKKMIESSTSLPPGRIIAWNNRSLKIYRWFKWRHLNGDYVEELKNRLVDAFSRYLPESFSLGFSGGLDSVLIAYVGSMLDRKFECITVGAEDSIDFQWAEEAALQLGLKLKKIKIDEKLVKNTVEVLSRYLVNPTIMDLSIASVFYLVATSSVHSIIISGQGADELFGGYYKYVKLGREKGLEYAQGVMMKDTLELHKTNIERDYLTVTTTGRKLIQPYLAKKIYEAALSTPINLKITPQNNSYRKVILRKVGRMLRLPDKLVWKPKKALQYSSKIQKMVSLIV